MSSERIHIHMVGSRGEGEPVPVIAPFADGYFFHNYDADADSTDQSQRHYEKAGLAARTHAVAVADRDGMIEIGIAYDPYASSILPLNADYANFYCPYGFPNGDYVLDPTLRAMKTAQVQATTLDRIAADPETPVDVLSVDVQGAERLVFDGAADCLRHQCVALLAEVSWHPLYAGQIMVGDVLQQAARAGFHFIRSFNHPPGSMFRGGVGWRGTGITIESDAVFFKDVRHVAACHPHPQLSLYKLAFIALSYDNMEYALWALQAARQGPADPRAGRLPFFPLLQEIAGLYDLSTAVFPPRFDQLYSFEESLRRFAPGTTGSGVDPLEVRRRYFTEISREKFMAGLRAVSVGETVLERLLHDNGFAGLARTLSTNRRRDLDALLAGLGVPGEQATTPDVVERFLFSEI